MSASFKENVLKLDFFFVGVCSSRGLLDDDNFYQRMSEINQEPVPYFRQLCETQYTTSSRPSSASSQSSDQSLVDGEFGGDLEQIPFNRQVTCGKQFLL